jgi:hypothetical protein
LKLEKVDGDEDWQLFNQILKPRIENKPFVFVTGMSGSRGLDVKFKQSAIVVVDIAYANSSELV